MGSISPELDDYLRAIYYDPSNPASYQSANRLYKYVVRQQGEHKPTLATVKKWLQNQENYSINKNVIRNFRRSRVLVSGIDDQWDADLADLSQFHKENDGYKYLLCVIDVFSRYAWVQPLTSKFTSEVNKAFTHILEKQDRKPLKLRTDAGKEFTNHEFKALMKRRNIHHFVTHNEKQANYVERFIQTLKRKIFRYIVGKNTGRYIDHLQQFVDSYNTTFHSGIQKEPNKVSQKNEWRLWWKMYTPKNRSMLVSTKKVTFAFRKGDVVRVTYTADAFDREYGARWTRELFRITERFVRQEQPVYKISEWDGTPVEGTFYEYELQKTEAPEEWKIEKIVKKGVGRNRGKVYVQWKGWPKKYNSWINENEIKDL